jgi:hypothetical protein
VVVFDKPAEREAQRLQRETGSRAAVPQASKLQPRCERRSLQDGNVRQMERDFRVGETGRSEMMPLRSRSIYIAQRL